MVNLSRWLYQVSERGREGEREGVREGGRAGGRERGRERERERGREGGRGKKCRDGSIWSICLGGFIK